MQHELLKQSCFIISLSFCFLVITVEMAPRISQAILIASGALTGIAAIAAMSWLRNRRQTHASSAGSTPHGTASTPASSGEHAPTHSRPNRLRRSRTVRRRRNNHASRNLADSNDADANALLSETEEDADNRKMLSLFKEWGEDDNRNLLNLLHAISENQSRKGKCARKQHRALANMQLCRGIHSS